jgi:KDO2-lipid IV(A) lauroyltransferase
MSADKVYSDWNVNAFNRAWVFSLADRGCRLLPRKVLYTVADSLMDWYQGRSPATLADVADNVARAFPALPAAKVQALASGTFRNYARGVVDYLRASFDPPVIRPAEGAASRFASIRGGRIIVTAHMGNWEVGGAALGPSEGPQVMVGFPERDPALEAYRRGRREANGQSSVGSGGEGMGILFRLRNVLEEGGSVIVLADRSVGKDGVEVIFRGRRARFLKSPALFSSLTGVPLVPVAIMADSPGVYTAHVGDPVSAGSDDAAIRAAMQSTADFFGGILERYPDQWYNFFRYWREGL